MRPRDFYKDDHIGWVKFGRIYSNVVSPPVMFILIGLAICLDSLPTWGAAFGWFFTYTFCVAIFPLLFVSFMLYTGRIEELHMSNTRERHLPYVMAIIGSTVAYGLISNFGGPELLRCLTLFNIIELVALSAVNVVWLISLHTTGAMATSTLIAVIWGLPLGLLIGIPLTVSVIWVRLFLRRHTPAQTYAGVVVGLLTVLVLIPFGCFS